MHINKVCDWYARAYYKAASGKEQGRAGANVIKDAVGASYNPARYERLKRLILRYLAGPLYWPTTWPTSIDPPTAEFLYSLIRLHRPEIAVEIGTYKGNAAIAIAQALKDNNKGRLHTIDPFDQEIVRTAVRKSGLDCQVKYHNGYSQDVIPGLELPRIDFAFIDGDHSYESVKRDVELISDLVPAGGVVVFHDVSIDLHQGFDGPKKMTEELAASGDWVVSIYPTEVGVSGDGRVVLSSTCPFGFTPVGIAVCIKK
jgi:MMP 1-O-methyltransferase